MCRLARTSAFWLGGYAARLRDLLPDLFTGIDGSSGFQSIASPFDYHLDVLDNMDDVLLIEVHGADADDGDPGSSRGSIGSFEFAP